MASFSFPGLRTVAAAAGILTAALFLVLRWHGVRQESEAQSAREAGRLLAALEHVFAVTPPDSLGGAGTAATVTRLLDDAGTPAEVTIHRFDSTEPLRWGSPLGGASPPVVPIDSLLRASSPGRSTTVEANLVVAAAPIEIGAGLPDTPPCPAFLVCRTDPKPALAAARSALLPEAAACLALLLPLLLLARSRHRADTGVGRHDQSADARASEEGRSFTLRRPLREELETVRASLREAEARLEEQARINTLRPRDELRALDSLTEGVFLADAAGRITGMNATASRLFSLDRSADPPADLRALFGSDRVAAALDAAGANPLPGFALIQHRVVSPEGAACDLEVSSRRLHDGGILGVVRPADTTPSPAAPGEAMARILLHSPLVGVLGCEGHTVRFANAAAEEITGRSQADLLDRPLWEIVHPDDREQARGMVETWMEPGNPGGRATVRILTPAGDLRWAELGALAAIVNGTPVLTAILHDRSGERALRSEAEEAARRYEALLAATQEAVLIVERGVVVAANPAASAMLRAGSVGELLNTPANRLLHPDDRATLIGLMREVLQRGAGSTGTPGRLLTLQGATVDAEISLHPTTREGRPALQLSARDRSAARAADRRLRAEHAHSEAALEHLPFACWIADRDGKILYQNPRSTAIHGPRTGETFLTWTTAGGDGAHLYSAVLRALRGEQVAITSAGDDGTAGSGHALVIPITVDGVVTSVLGVDLAGAAPQRTDSGEAPGGKGPAGSGAHAAREPLMRTILENLPVVLFAVDADGAVTFSAGKGLAQPGMDPGSGQPAFSLSDREGGMEQLVRRALAGERVRDVVALHGGLFDTWCEPLRDGGGAVRGAIGVAADVTDRIHAEEALARLNAELENRVAERTAQLETSNRELEAFSYSVSHDLRTPLRAIEGFTHILREEHSSGLDAEGRQLLTVVADSAGHMTRLIDDLLTFSRMSRKDLDRTPIDMMAMFRSVAEELTPAMADVPSLKLTIDPLPAANGDLGMIRQVAVNLVANAVKFSRTRRTPCIEVGSFTGGDGRPVYYVQDNGVGFDMKHAHKLFNVFQRLHSADQFEGTGVGLAIVHRILARHGGRVWADAQPGRGATFFFTW